MRYRSLFPLLIAVLALALSIVAIALALMCISRSQPAPQIDVFDHLYSAVTDPPHAPGFCIANVGYSPYSQAPYCGNAPRVVWITQYGIRAVAVVPGVKVGDLWLQYGRPDSIQPARTVSRLWVLQWGQVRVWAVSQGRGLNMHANVTAVILSREFGVESG